MEKNICYVKPSHKMLGYGTYKDVKWAILSHAGIFPVAYIENKWDLGVDDIEVHGGVTFAGNAYWNKEEEHVQYLGWDYGHIDDFSNYKALTPEMDIIEENVKKWTYEEIKAEVFNAIDQMIAKVKKD